MLRSSRSTPCRTWQARAAVVTLITVVGLLTGSCAPSSAADPESSGQQSSVAAVPELRDRVPADIRDRGELRVVTDASYPPIEAFAEDGRTIVGVDPDIAAALGALLGIKFTLINVDFGELISIVQRGDAELVMSAMTDTLEREAEIDFINYFSAGTSIVVQRGNPQLVTDLSTLCGHAVAVEGDTTQELLINRYQTRCDVPVTVLIGQTNDDALVLLRTGRAVAVLMDFPSAEYLTTEPETHGRYELASTTQYEPGLYGIGVAKDRPDLRSIIADALATLIETGTYLDILTNWNVADSAVSQVSINAAGG